MLAVQVVRNHFGIKVFDFHVWIRLPHGYNGQFRPWAFCDCILTIVPKGCFVGRLAYMGGSIPKSLRPCDAGKARCAFVLREGRADDYRRLAGWGTTSRRHSRLSSETNGRDRKVRAMRGGWVRRWWIRWRWIIHLLGWFRRRDGSGRYITALGQRLRFVTSMHIFGYIALAQVSEFFWSRRD